MNRELKVEIQTAAGELDTRAPGALDAVPAFDVASGETADEARPLRRAKADRKSLLQESAEWVGTAWARGLCESIRGEGRPIEGGWPGTVVEARAHVAGRLGETLARRKMAPLTGEELSAASDLAYARARQHWLGVLREVKLAARRRKTTE